MGETVTTKGLSSWQAAEILRLLGNEMASVANDARNVDDWNRLRWLHKAVADAINVHTFKQEDR
jgi:hypothetical protein